MRRTVREWKSTLAKLGYRAVWDRLGTPSKRRRKATPDSDIDLQVETLEPRQMLSGVTFTSPGSASFAENGTGVALDVNAIVQPHGLIDYTIAGGVDASKFTIGVANGHLKFKTAPDFENPTDSGANNVYNVTVRAKKRGSHIQKTQNITITVTDVNENYITFSSSASASVAENTPTSTVIKDVNASNPANPSDPITYSISGGADSSRFSIISSNGKLKFNSSPDYENPTDSGTNNVYQVIVKATGASGAWKTQTINVTVTDQADDVIVFQSGSTANVAENSPTSTVVLDVNASNTGNPNDTITYSITGGDDASQFTIDADGKLRLTAVPDFENPADANGDNAYHVTVRADGANSSWASQAVVVTVTDQVEDVVEFSSAATASLPENSPTSAVALNVDAANIGNASDPITYALVGGVDSALFAIDSSTGELRFTSVRDFEAPTDSGTNNVYDVVVKATGASGASQTQAIAITVSDVVEHELAFSSASSATVAENIATATAAHTVVASNIVVGTDPITYTISGGVDQASLAIDSSTGALTFVSSPNFEVPADSGTDNVYNVEVRATGASGATATQALSITVTDVDEGVIAFSGATSATTPENVAPSTALLTVTASNSIDASQTMTYSISGGDDGTNFAIDSSTGALTFVAPPNFESPADANTDNVYHVAIEAAGPYVSAVQSFSITVTDINDAPSIVSPALLNVAENTTRVIDVAGQDEDWVSHTITLGAQNLGINVDDTVSSGTGYFLHFTDNIARFTFDNPSNSSVDITIARHQGGHWQYADGANWINFIPEPSDRLLASVDFANDAAGATVLAPGDTVADWPGAVGSQSSDLSYLVNTWNGEFNDGEYAVEGTQYTAEGYEAVTYAITGGLDAALFAIDANTGELGFQVAQDFETPGDLDADNVFHVEVTVTDESGNQTTQALEVSVVDVVNEQSMVILGDQRQGIAVDDAVASGIGYFMHFTEDSGRFSVTSPTSNSEDFVIVQYDGAQWLYNTDAQWSVFTPKASDRLMAYFHFDNDALGATVLGTSDIIADWTGAIGSDAGDLRFEVNTWNGQANDGEYTVIGTYYAFNEIAEGTTDPWMLITPLGSQNRGIAVDDSVTSGTGYFMHFTENSSRFTLDSAQHSNDFVMVRDNGGVWEYNTGSAWAAFTPEASDRLLASVDFADDAAGATAFTPSDTVANWTAAIGAEGGNLSFHTNTWNTYADDGEYMVRGSHYAVDSGYGRLFPSASLVLPASTNIAELYGAQSFDFTVELSDTFYDDVTVRLVPGLTAREGLPFDYEITTNDGGYQSASRKLTFKPGETTKTLTVTALHDRVLESTEDLQLQLEAIRNVTSGLTTVLSGNVSNNDGLEWKLVSDTTSGHTEGTAVEYRLTLINEQEPDTVIGYGETAVVRVNLVDITTTPTDRQSLVTALQAAADAYNAQTLATATSPNRVEISAVSDDLVDVTFHGDDHTAFELPFSISLTDDAESHEWQEEFRVELLFVNGSVSTELGIAADSDVTSAILKNSNPTNPDTVVLDEGQSLTHNVMFASAPSAASYQVLTDRGGAVTPYAVTPVTVTPNGGNNDVSVDFDLSYADSGSESFDVWLMDASTNTPLARKTVQVTVNDVAPTVQLSTQRFTSGSDWNARIEFSASDVGRDTVVAWTIDWGDGTVETLTGLDITSATHLYELDQDYTVTVTPIDEDGVHTASATTDTVVFANHVAIDLRGESGLEGVKGQSFTQQVATFAISDPTTNALYDVANSGSEFIQVTIDWGDGNTSYGMLVDRGDYYEVLGTHTYQTDGVFNIDVTVESEAQSETLNQSLTVWNTAPIVALLNSPLPANTVIANYGSDNDTTYTPGHAVPSTQYVTQDIYLNRTAYNPSGPIELEFGTSGGNYLQFGHNAWSGTIAGYTVSGSWLGSGPWTGSAVGLTDPVTVAFEGGTPQMPNQVKVTITLPETVYTYPYEDVSLSATIDWPDNTTSDGEIADVFTDTLTPHGEVTQATGQQHTFTQEMSGLVQTNVTVDDGTSTNVFSLTTPISVIAGVNDDTYTVRHFDSIDTAGDASLASVIDNDYHQNAVSLLQGPESGTLVLDPSGDFTYTPEYGFDGVVTFTYQNGSDVGQVSIDVTGTPVVAIADQFIFTPAKSFHFDVLKNDFVAGASNLQVVVTAAPAHGQLIQNSVTGQFIYFPGDSFSGSDQLTYYLTDGTVTSQTTTVDFGYDMSVIGAGTPRVEQFGLISDTGLISDGGTLDEEGNWIDEPVVDPTSDLNTSNPSVSLIVAGDFTTGDQVKVELSHQRDSNNLHSGFLGYRYQYPGI